MDTGSHLIWVAKKNHNGTTNITNFYYPNISSISQKTEEKYYMIYGTGFVLGYYYYDNIEYIPNKISIIKFGVAEKVYFTVPGVDGIMGLGREYQDEEKSFITSLRKSGHIDARAFSIKFKGQFVRGSKGSMFIGIHDDFYKNGTVTCHLNKGTEISWKANITSFGLKNNQTKIYSKEFEVPFSFDTGTNIFSIPKEYFNDIKNDLNKFDCEIVNEKNKQRYKCKKDGNYPDLQFKINGYIFTIPKEESHFEKPDDKDYLYSKVITIDNYHSFIMGTAFFFNFHTLFNMDEEELKFYPIKEGILQFDSPDLSNLSDSQVFPIQSKKLNTVSIVIIVIGCFIFVIVVSLIIYYVIVKQKKDKEKYISIPVDNSEQRLFKEEE